ncbi:MAG TPA: glycosyltransferase, partial [Xanthobacteraceae bacterium]|nr:glycosyltransferase [Xanthobacteraceae bacterium]
GRRSYRPSAVFRRAEENLNILVVGEAGTWFDHHVIASLRDIGHHVSVFHYGNAVGEYYSRARWSERAAKNRALLKQATELKADRGLDLIFCYVYDDFLLPDVAAALSALGAPMVNYNVDMTNQWYRQIRTARYFTTMLCAQRVHMNDLARYGAPVDFFPMAARAPNVADGHAFEIRSPVSFLGTPMPDRIAVLDTLSKAGVSLAIYGKFWNEGLIASADHNLQKTFDDIIAYGVARCRAEGIGALWAVLMLRLGDDRYDGGPSKIDASLLHGFLSDADVPALFRNSKINLGFTRMAPGDPDRPGAMQVKLRDFEVPSCGGFYLVERAPDYAEFFVEGREMVTWRTVGELMEKIRYYLDHESERRAIAVAGERRALREHLWKHRFSALFAKLGIG